MFFLFIFIIILFLIIAVHTIKLGIEIQNFKINTECTEKINKNYQINIYLSIFNRIKILNKDIKEIKIRNKDLDIRILKKKDLKIDYKEVIQNINIEKIDLNIQIGTQDAALTAIIVGIMASVLGILIRKPRYEVIPIYSGKNFIKIRLDSIFTVNLTHYIYSQIFKRWGGNKNERTSNRKSYVNSYE